MTQPNTTKEGTRLGEMLVSLGLVDQVEVNRCLQIARMHEVPLGEPLVTLGILEEVDLLIVLHLQGAARVGKLRAQALTQANSMIRSLSNQCDCLVSCTCQWQSTTPQEGRWQVA